MTTVATFFSGPSKDTPDSGGNLSAASGRLSSSAVKATSTAVAAAATASPGITGSFPPLQVLRSLPWLSWLN